MSDFIIINVDHGLTGLVGEQARVRGAIRVRDGVIAQMGDLRPRAGRAHRSAG